MDWIRACCDVFRAVYRICGAGWPQRHNSATCKMCWDTRCEFERACCAGDIDAAESMLSLQHFSREVEHNAFQCACENGQLAVVRWYCDRFGLNAENYARLHQIVGYALRLSCLEGHLAVAAWLCRHFVLSKKRDGEYVCNAFVAACSNGHLDVAKWLHATFALNQSDVRKRDLLDQCAFEMACVFGRVDVAVWLRDEFGLNSTDLNRVVAGIMAYAHNPNCERIQDFVYVMFEADGVEPHIFGGKQIPNIYVNGRYITEAEWRAMGRAKFAEVRERVQSARAAAQNNIKRGFDAGRCPTPDSSQT